MLERFDKMLYTKNHRKAFLKIEKELTGKNTFSGYLHDLDKLFLYPILGVKLAHKIHRKYSKHHIPRCLNKKNTIIQAIIDWECARFTKPDKPLNARDTLNKYYSEYFSTVDPVLKELNL